MAGLINSTKQLIRISSDKCEATAYYALFFLVAVNSLVMIGTQ